MKYPKNLKKLKSLLFVIIIAAILLECLCHLQWVDTFFVPAPSKIITTAYKMIQSGQLQQYGFITLKRLFFGFCLGAFLGFFGGSICGTSRRLRVLFEPLVYLLYPIPRFVFYPFLVLIFGIGDIPMIIFISMGAFFPLFIDTLGGIRDIDTHYFEVANHYGASGWMLYKRVILPGSLPAIFNGLRISIGIALLYTIIAEFLTATKGIGAMMWLSLQTLRIDQLFLGAILVAALNTIFIFIIVYMESILMPWHRDKRELVIP